MQLDVSSALEKIFVEFDKIGKGSKAIMKYGSQIFLGLFAVGTLLVGLNHSQLNFNFYSEFIATSLIKSSFSILAEVIIGGLLIDYILRRK